MAYNKIDGRPPLNAASLISAYMPVSFLQAGSALSETVIQTATWNIIQLGLTLATVASVGDPVTLAYPNEVAKAFAGASLGAGCLVAVGSTNGVLAPVTPSGAASAAAYPLRYAVGYAVSNAAAGDEFSVLIAPQQVV